ncbi:MAG: SDR family NAD(P)-dependent oxidoreductase [Rhodospirillales bacterium]
MKRLEDQTILVTGATDGIGKGTAAELARRGAFVLLHGRDAGRLAQTQRDIAKETGNPQIGSYQADFASLADVRALAGAVEREHDRLDVLINNAGIGRGRRGEQHREESADGFELRFQVNHLAPFLLTHLLLPLLRAAAPARIVNVASAGQTPIDFDDVMLERDYDGTRAYCQSKLAMVMATFDLAERLDPGQITVNALHPGTLLDTKMVREAWGGAQGPVETGIDSEVHLAAAPELDGISGQYFHEKRRSRADSQAYDEQARRRLVALSERLIGL